MVEGSLSTPEHELATVSASAAAKVGFHGPLTSLHLFYRYSREDCHHLLEALKIGRSRFFALLKALRDDPANGFCMQS